MVHVSASSARSSLTHFGVALPADRLTRRFVLQPYAPPAILQYAEDDVATVGLGLELDDLGHAVRSRSPDGVLNRSPVRGLLLGLQDHRLGRNPSLDDRR